MSFQYPDGERCCKASEPESNCRCHVAEREIQYGRMLARIEAKDTFTRAEVAEYVWRERLRIMALATTELDLSAEDAIRFCELSCEAACDHSGDKPSAEAVAIARRMDELCGLRWASEAFAGKEKR